MSEPLSVLVVGCGQIAGLYADDGVDPDQVLTHAGAYARDPRFRLAACVDPDPEKRAAFMARWGAAAGFADLEAALAAGSYDVASVCSPTAAHAADLDRLRASPVRAVFAEKPLAADAAAARAQAAAWAADGRPIIVNHLRRFDPAMQALRAELAAGAYGEIRAASAVYGRGVLNNGSHAVDLLSFLLGAPLRVVAAAPARIEPRAPEPSVDALLAAGEVPVHLVSHDGGDYGLFEVSLICAHAVAAIEQSGFTLRIRRAGPSARFPGLRELGAAETRATGLGRAMSHAVGALAAALAGDRSGLVSTPATAAAALETCHELLERGMAARLGDAA